eukprot:jgi/Tetstr1/459376/TSEL_004755.t1
MAMASNARPVDAEARLLLLQDRIAKAESAVHAHFATAAAYVHAASRPGLAPRRGSDGRSGGRSSRQACSGRQGGRRRRQGTERCGPPG